MSLLLLNVLLIALGPFLVVAPAAALLNWAGRPASRVRTYRPRFQFRMPRSAVAW